MPTARIRALAEIHRDADALVEVVLDRLGLVPAHGDRQPVALGNLAFAGRGARALCRIQYELGELLELRLGVGKAILLRHGALS
ncbi:hypothetical protein D3C83_26680 [compost metagenome]